MTLVPAGPAHAAVLEALHAACFDDGWPAGDFVRLLETPGCFALIAMVADEPAGLAVCRAAVDECELLTIGVIPEFRRRHLGFSLLNATFATARGHGAVRYFLDVAEDNLAACALYCSVGFAQVGRRPNYYRRAGAGVAALVLALDLGPIEESGQG